MRFTANSYQNLVKAVGIFQRLIGPLGLADRQIVNSDPRAFNMAVKAAAAAAGVPPSWLSLAVFGRTLSGHNNVSTHRSRHYAGSSGDRFDCYYSNPQGLVEITFGKCPEGVSTILDNSACLFLQK